MDGSLRPAALALLGCFLAPGCFSPRLSPCEVRCTAGACLGAGECGADDFCHAPGDDTDCRLLADARTSDGPAGCADWVPLGAHFDPCALAPPAADRLVLEDGNFKYDTDTGELSGPAVTTSPASTLIDGARVVSVSGFGVRTTAFLRVVGARPLIVAAWSSATIEGTIDVSSSRALGAGAGSPGPSCEAATPGAGSQDASGGGGGGYGGAGGAGGFGKSGDNPASPGGAAQASAPTRVLAGCRGAPGGGNEGSGGLGGGALQLTARDEITIAGRLLAGGAGGGGASGDAGGGGGGSGGYLGLAAPTILLGAGAILAANGGGGGTGCDGGDGPDGVDGLPVAVRAPGGAASCGTGAGGGAGGADGTADGLPGADSDQSGGGGGGGVGFVLVWSPGYDAAGMAIVSPGVTRF